MSDKTNKALRNLLIYQIFIRNYSEEGNFAAVEKDLDRIKELGTDIISFLPIYPIGEEKRKGALGSPYSVKDHRAVNPEYGTFDDFKKLVDSIHAKGMRCTLDVVFHHTSPDSQLAKEHPEWFYHNPDGTFGNRVGAWSDVIDLDYSNKELWDYQIETLKLWAEHVDGFRCDVAPLVPIEFWIKARSEIEQIKPDFIWLAESVEPEFILYLRNEAIDVYGDGEMFRAFDICYDYDIHPEFKDYFDGKIPLKTYLDAINNQEYIYPENYVKLRSLENRDHARARTLVTDGRSLRDLTAFSFFQKGTAFIYAGQEFGASHTPSLFEKDTVDMRPEDGVDLTELIKKLSEIKKGSIFADSSFHASACEGDVVVARHVQGKNITTGIFSLKGKRAKVKTAIPDGSYVNCLDDKEIVVSDGWIDCDGTPIIISYN